MPIARRCGVRFFAAMPTHSSSTRQKRYHLTTFGCQMNEHDSERMKGMLESLGYGEAVSYTHLTLPTNREV